MPILSQKIFLALFIYLKSNLFFDKNERICQRNDRSNLSNKPARNNIFFNKMTLKIDQIEENWFINKEKNISL